MVYDLPGDIALGLKKVVERSASSAGPINSYYPALHQHVPGPAFLADLKKVLEASVAEALQSINYNTHKKRRHRLPSMPLLSRPQMPVA